MLNLRHEVTYEKKTAHFLFETDIINHLPVIYDLKSLVTLIHLHFSVI